MRLAPLTAALDTLLATPLPASSDPRRRRLRGASGFRRASAISAASGDSAGSAVTAESGNASGSIDDLKSFACSSRFLSLRVKAENAASFDSETSKQSARSTRRLSLRVRAKDTSTELLALLNDAQADVMVRRGSEKEYSGRYCNFFPVVGCFTCKGCRKPLYSAQSKFDARSGYPSFDQCFEGAVIAKTEIGWRRTVALRCAGCAGHLGHLFEGEWLSATNERHSVNSVALEYDHNPCMDEEVCLRSLHV